jgi:hypothetical protein
MSTVLTVLCDAAILLSCSTTSAQLSCVCDHVFNKTIGEIVLLPCLSKATAATATAQVPAALISVPHVVVLAAVSCKA